MLIGIVCVSNNNGIGKNNKCLFRLKTDRQFFHDKIDGKTVVIGKNTYKYLPSNVLKSCKHVHILSKQTPLPESYIFSDEEIFVIGGEKTYASLARYCSKYYVTHIYSEPEADAFFCVTLDKFSEQLLANGAENGLKYDIKLYTK